MTEADTSDLLLVLGAGAVRVPQGGRGPARRGSVVTRLSRGPSVDRTSVRRTRMSATISASDPSATLVSRSTRRYNSVHVSQSEKPAQRRAERVRPGPLRIDVHQGPSGTLIDLSEYGALLELPAGQPVGGRLTFDLHWDTTPILMHGRVVRSTPRYEGSWRVEWMEPDSYHVAVEFFDLAAQCATTLRELLRKAAPPPLPPA